MARNPNPSNQNRRFPAYLRHAGYVGTGSEYVRRGGFALTPTEYLLRAGYRNPDLPDISGFADGFRPGEPLETA